MAFKVVLSSDEATVHSYSDNDVYKLPSSGKLIVEPEGDTATFTYASWIYLKADADHHAGRTKGGKSGGRTAFVG
jgi:hypothetical protein